MNVDQSTFRRALLDPNIERPDGLRDGRGHSAGRRFDVYRNNVAIALIEALETAFPVVAKLVGNQNFRALAGAFFRQHPPTSPVMMFYGDRMPEFLGQYAPTSRIGYLPDVARLELALRESYHAADTRPIEPGELQSLSPDELMAATLTLAPPLRLIRSKWPVHAIWRFNTEENAPKPEMRAEDVVVLRNDMDPEPHPLPDGGGAFIAALKEGVTLGKAYERAEEAAANFDLFAVLSLLIGAGAITAIGVER